MQLQLIIYVFFIMQELPSGSYHVVKKQQQQHGDNDE